jgi:DNA repair exonuclease SbcCD ATPase subunit
MLEKVYDLFGVSQFPRKLIETYMVTVEDTLTKYLQYFNLSHQVKVEAGFKIRLYPIDSPKALPQVSGGQEMMIGICLRLALHKMFAQAFPIWIIDEGTTHLSESKKQSYFELVNVLRTQKIIKQIIIIDHDERLSTVVDQTIEL